ncbi:MAG: hypothetical protein ABJN84_02455 [Flavobacteriaceae bacterium]
MDTILYVETIKKECAFLEKEGYTFTQLENNIYYTKETDLEGFRIRFSWLEYGDTFAVQGLTAEKRYNIIEQEIQKVLGGKFDSYYTIHTSPSVNNAPKGLEITNFANNTRYRTNTVNDIELFCGFVKFFYESSAIVFFDNHKEFTKTAELYGKLEREKISSLIINDGTDIFYRELVIKNKAKSIDENDFVEMVITELEPLKTNSTFGTILENFKLLQSNLQANV